MAERDDLILVIAEALDCFWNAAIGAAHARGDFDAMSTATVVSQGVAAVSARLREIAAESEVLSAAPPAPTREEVARVLGKIDGAKWTDTYVQFTTPEHNGPPEKYYRMADAILALLGGQS